MTDRSQEWGEFSEWLDEINRSIEQKGDAEKESENLYSVNRLVEAMSRWMQQLSDAPMTTWAQELEVRGYNFEYHPDYSDAEIHEKLWKLIFALAGMKVYLTNSDHLSDRHLYRRLTQRYTQQPIAQIPFADGTGCMIDVVGSETQDNPDAWLRYYASSRERMEWAKQNVGKTLPPSEEMKYPRESNLPKP